MKTDDFDYHLPGELIAQTPVETRDQSRLMVLRRGSGCIDHHRFADVTDYLRAGDVLVFNDSRVIPARLYGRKVDGGGRVEFLLLQRQAGSLWQALVKPGKRLLPGDKVTLDEADTCRAEVVGVGQNGTRLVSFSDESRLPALGKVPLPPYIHATLADPERYQTVYARVDGSAAAPTAGLHFTPELLERIKAKGVTCLFVTLHIGLDTFSPVREEDPRSHHIHTEYGVLDDKVARALSQAKQEGRRVICVGTTSVRLVEQAAQSGVSVQPFAGPVSLFILPGYQFQVVDALITNFHLPRSTLLMLVSAFCGKGLITQAYQEAIARKYRFYSFGDAMLVL